MAELPAGSPSPISLPPVDSGDVSQGGDFPDRPAVPQDWPGDGMQVVGLSPIPNEQGVSVLPPFPAPDQLWPSDSGLQAGTPAGQSVGPSSLPDPRSSEYAAPDGIQAATPGQADDAGSREPSSDTVMGAVANAGANQAELSGDLLVQGKAYGDHVVLPADAYTQDGPSDVPSLDDTMPDTMGQ